jgi:hypothetical protein
MDVTVGEEMQEICIFNKFEETQGFFLLYFLFGPILSTPIKTAAKRVSEFSPKKYIKNFIYNKHCTHSQKVIHGG